MHARSQTQRFRDLAGNRREARKLLRLKLDEFINGAQSKRALQQAKLQRQKAKQRQRSQRKSQPAEPGGRGDDGGTSDRSGDPPRPPD